MDLQDVATRPVKPCDNDELVAGGNAIQCPSGPRLYLEPCIRRALGTLSGRFTARLERGADHADGLQTGSGRRVAPLLLGNHAGSLFVDFLALFAAFAFDQDDTGLANRCRCKTIYNAPIRPL